MDTSEQYIKMRVAAIPDLGVGTPREVSSTVEGATTGVSVDNKGNYHYTDVHHPKYVLTCQLEKQGQLQAVVGSFIKCYEMLDEYYCTKNGCLDYPYGSGIKIAYWEQFLSMEQLWLAFVMKEKYGKVWDGETWREPPS